MTENEWFEIRAKAFHEMRGMLPPGKDAPAAVNMTYDYATRTAAWLSWNNANARLLNAIRNALSDGR